MLVVILSRLVPQATILASPKDLKQAILAHPKELTFPHINYSQSHLVVWMRNVLQLKYPSSLVFGLSLSAAAGVSCLIHSDDGSESHRTAQHCI